MNWSFRIAQIVGIDIRVHVTFFLILLLGAFQWSGTTPDSLLGATFGVVLMILLFTSVTLHELGHSLMARRFAIPVKAITLLPLGGVAEIERNPEKPLHDLLISVAGPLVNIAIAGVLLLLIGVSSPLALLNGHGLMPHRGNEPSFDTLLAWLLTANISLFVFNLIPAYPLDGGRILRAVLAMILGYPKATTIAATIGQSIAIVLGVFGLLSGNFILALIAVFVFFGASQETAEVAMKSVLTTRQAGDACNKDVPILMSGDRVSKVVEVLLNSPQQEFPVKQGTILLGIVTRDSVLRALASSRDDLYVTEIMHRDYLRVNATQTLDEARDAMAQKQSPVAAVYAGDRYIGLLSERDLQEAFTILSFVQRQAKARVAT